MKRIHESLDRLFKGHRLVFWYDADGGWRLARRRPHPPFDEVPIDLTGWWID
jgi:hypothetical protein